MALFIKCERCGQLISEIHGEIYPHKKFGQNTRYEGLCISCVVKDSVSGKISESDAIYKIKELME